MINNPWVSQIFEGEDENLKWRLMTLRCVIYTLVITHMIAILCEPGLKVTLLLLTCRCWSESSSAGSYSSRHSTFSSSNFCKHALWIWSSCCRSCCPSYHYWRFNCSCCWWTRKYEPGMSTGFVSQYGNPKENLFASPSPYSHHIV
jgi:hypothetical protein